MACLFWDDNFFENQKTLSGLFYFYPVVEEMDIMFYVELWA